MKTIKNTFNIKNTIKKNRKHCFYGLVLIVMILISACEDFVVVDDPKGELTPDVVFSTDASATAAILAVYLDFTQWIPYNIAHSTSLAADELTNFSTTLDQQQFFANEITTNNGIVERIWEDMYESIYTTNAVIEGVSDANNDLKQETKTLLEGEARFLRAFSYFYLLNLYGDIPLITGTDYQVNAAASRSSTTDVYDLIIADLTKAQTFLNEDYPTNKRIRANKSAASAMLARVHLYLENWTEAESHATTVINNTALYELESNLLDAFLPNNEEAVLQVFPPSTISTWEGYYFILTSTPPFNVALSDDFINSFEDGDQRLNDWVGSISDGTNDYYYAYKYKSRYTSEGIEYPTLLRLAEQYLIRAEARAQQDNITGAQDDLNSIRNRAGLSNTTANDKASLLLAIEQERRVELFTEWGHRWFDLKRTGRAATILSPIKTGWQDTDELFPIPHREITNSPNLTQNPGY